MARGCGLNGFGSDGMLMVRRAKQIQNPPAEIVQAENGGYGRHEYVFFACYSKLPDLVELDAGPVRMLAQNGGKDTLQGRLLKARQSSRRLEKPRQRNEAWNAGRWVHIDS